MAQIKNKTSDRKFGIFFSIIFLILSSFFFYAQSFDVAFSLVFISLLIFIVSLFKSAWLKEFNDVWFKFGLLLSKLISPLILAMIFYFIITPFGMIKKIFKLGTIHYKTKDNKTFWRDCGKLKTDYNKPF